MKSTIAILLTIILGIVLTYALNKKLSKSKKVSTDSRISIIVSMVFGVGFLAMCVGSASVTIHTITECTKTGHTKADYFLVYTAHFSNNETKTVFLPPYGDDWVQNDTNNDLALHSIVYGKSESYPTQKLPSFSLTKTICPPSFFFESPPRKIRYSTNARYPSKGKTKGLVLRYGEPNEY